MPHVELQFYSGADLISAWYCPGEGDGPRPALVFCPGFTGTKHAAFYKPYVEALNQAGYGVLMIDYRGWGDSAGKRGAIYALRQVEDIRNGLSYLESRDDVRADLLGVFGVSFGAGHATYVAGIDERVKCAIAVSPVADGERWLKSMRSEQEWAAFKDRLAKDRRSRVLTGTGERVDPAEDIMIQSEERRNTSVKGWSIHSSEVMTTPLTCGDEILRYRPLDVASRIAPRALLLFSFSGDTVVDPIEHAEEIYAAAAEPKHIVRLEGSTHYAGYVDHRDAIIEQTLTWCATHLSEGKR